MVPRRRWYLLIALGSWVSLVCGGEPGPNAESPAAPAAQKWALLVGVNDYAELNDLQYCRRDMELLRERLVEAGFPDSNVTVLHDGQKQSLSQPFRASIAHHLVELLRKVGPDDLLLFAFSGHGMEADGAGYLCPVDAQLGAPAGTLIAIDAVYRGLGLCRARQKILLIDACRNDPRPGGERNIERVGGANTAFARSLEQPPEGIVVLTSCRPGQVSVEDDKMGHGVFLYFVMEGLRGEADRVGGNGDGKVSVFELYRYTDTRTRAFVARSRDLIQTPVLCGELTADFELGASVHREREVQQAWAMVRDDADALFDQSALLKWLQQMYRRQMQRGNSTTASSWDTAVDRLLHRPEPIVLSNPSLITAQQPEALFALQRAYAFGLRGDADGVLAAATEAIGIEPDNPFAYLLRAMAHAEKASRLQMVRRMITVTRDPRVLAQAIRSSARNSAVSRQFQEVLRELNAVNPDMAIDLELARTDPNAFVKAIEATLNQLEEASPLTLAVQDYERVGLGLPCMLVDGTQLRSGREVVGRVRGYTELFAITKADGSMLLAERTGEGPRLKGWIGLNDVSNLIPFFQQIEMIPNQ